MSKVKWLPVEAPAVSPAGSDLVLAALGLPDVGNVTAPHPRVVPWIVRERTHRLLRAAAAHVLQVEAGELIEPGDGRGEEGGVQPLERGSLILVVARVRVSGVCQAVVMSYDKSK